jgi:hypothetical protein
MGFLNEWFGVDDSGVGQVARQAASGTTDILYYLLLLIIAAVIVYLIWYRLQFRIKFRIRELTDERVIIYDDYAKEFENKKKEKWMVLWKKRTNVQLPPSQVIDVNNKGKKVVEAYLLPGGSFVWCKDIGKHESIPEDFLDSKLPKEIVEIQDEVEREKEIEKFRADKKQKLDEWMKTHKYIEAYKPVTTADRHFMVSQHQKALDEQSKEWKDYIIPLAYVASITILIALIIVYNAELAKPLLEQADKQLARDQEMTKQLEILRDIKQDVQTIKSQQGIASAPPPE